eukprot:2011274-Prymnesium_polylepis.1
MSKFKFAHRDLQDNNTMIKIVREPVTKCEDVEVYLVDFGKATCLIGEDMLEVDLALSGRSREIVKE